MSDINHKQTDRGAIGINYVTRPGPRAMDAMIAVAAEMALADGRADRAEHLGLLGFMRQREILVSVGRSETNRRFNAEIQRVMRPDAGDDAVPAQDIRWKELIDRLRPLAGMEVASLILAAAAHVAAADGVLHPEETELLRSLSGALNLDPIAVDDRA